MKKFLFVFFFFAASSTLVSFTSEKPLPKKEYRLKFPVYFAGTYYAPAANNCTWIITAGGYGVFDDQTGQLVGIVFWYFTAQLSCPHDGWGYAKDITDPRMSYSGTSVTDITIGSGNDPQIIDLFNDSNFKSGFLSWLNSQINP